MRESGPTLSPGLGALVDAVVAVAVAAPGLTAMSVSGGGFAVHDVFAAGALLVCAGSVVARHRWPFSVSMATAASYVLAVQTGADLLNPKASSPAADLASAGILLTCFVLALSLGSTDSLVTSVLGVAALAAATQWHQANPFPVMVVLGPWLIGRVLRSRQRLAVALESRGTELDSERERYAAESVRYERARVAREMHDIIAHCMSVVVIQAAAARRLDDTDRGGTEAALMAISGLARQAELDITALTRLLCANDTLARPLSRAVVDQLIAHASATGTAIDISVSGDLDAIPPVASATLHRVLQEGLTNAFKHAPGARISISVATGKDATHLEISNQRAHAAATTLNGHGGGNGLTGMIERVGALSGTLSAGPTEQDGWLLIATIPVMPSEAVSAATGPGRRGAGRLRLR